MTGVHRSEAWLQAQQKRAKGGWRVTWGGDCIVDETGTSLILPNLRKRKPPNKTEEAYAKHLELRKRAGEVLWWKFEGMRLRLADGAWFKPDFAVLRSLVEHGTGWTWLEFHECKGWMREAANVRLKVAADLYPFRFLLVRATDRRLLTWQITEVR